jgi:hypothetical protein
MHCECALWPWQPNTGEWKQQGYRVAFRGVGQQKCEEVTCRQLLLDRYIAFRQSGAGHGRSDVRKGLGCAWTQLNRRGGGADGLNPPPLENCKHVQVFTRLSAEKNLSL